MTLRTLLGALGVVLAAAGCSAEPIPASAPRPVLGATRQVVPGSGFPAEVTTDVSNNNLDVVAFEGRTFLTFRTAPSHFASSTTLLYVVSSTDRRTWDFEAKFHLGTDLREPRFFAWRGRLQLYFASLGSDPNAFEPGRMWRVERSGPGDWTAPEETFGADFIPWRIRVFPEVSGDRPILVGYEGGANIYNFSGDPLSVYLLTTTDGDEWVPLDAGRPVVLEGGMSETDVAFDAEGNLFAVSRNEAGDSEGFGSFVCRAPKEDLTAWTCHRDRRKFDSPLLFAHAGEIWLIARRNVTEDGNYDLGRDDLSWEGRFALYQLDYWRHPKRCSLWRIDRERVAVEFVLDLPSRGDTCFPSILPAGEDRFVVYNYSNDVDGPDLSWHEGQLAPTNLYETEISFH